MYCVIACRSLLSRKLMMHSMLALPALILLVQLLDSMPADQAAPVKKLNGSNSALLEVTVMLAEVCSLCSSSLVVRCVIASPEVKLFCLPCCAWPGPAFPALPLPCPCPCPCLPCPAMPCFGPLTRLPALCGLALPCLVLPRPALPCLALMHLVERVCIRL